MPHDHTARTWFFRKLSHEAFLFSAAVFALLFLCEFLKPGFVSNYLSLPMAALAVCLLALLSLAMHPLMVLDSNRPKKTTDYAVLVFLSLLLILVILTVAGSSSAALTGMLIFVTVASLFAA